MGARSASVTGARRAPTAPRSGGVEGRFRGWLKWRGMCRECQERLKIGAHGPDTTSGASAGLTGRYFPRKAVRIQRRQVLVRYFPIEEAADHPGGDGDDYARC
jgi:hypothetical protein